MAWGGPHIPLLRLKYVRWRVAKMRLSPITGKAAARKMRCPPKTDKAARQSFKLKVTSVGITQVPPLVAVCRQLFASHIRSAGTVNPYQTAARAGLCDGLSYDIADYVARASPHAQGSLGNDAPCR